MSERGVRDRIVETVAALPTRLYSGPIRRIVTALGLESLLERTHSSVFAIFRDDIVEVSVAGHTATFAIESPIEYRRLTGRLQETNRPILESLLADVEPTDVVWDVGAHVGRYSCFLGQVVESGNLVAVEAHPANAEHLAGNLSLNGIEATVLQTALTDATTTVTFSLDHDRAGEFIRGSEYTDGVGDAYERLVEVEAVTGDQLVADRNCPPPTVVRIDVTGGEPQALDGMADQLADERCRLVYVTLYRDRYDDPDAVESRLRAAGFGTITSEDGWLKAERT